MRRLRILVLLHPDLMPPESSKGYSEQEINVWKTEYDVVTTLRAAGHEVRPLGVHDELKPIREQIESWKPNVVFTLLEQFRGEVIYDHNVASYLELTRVPYTGCNPRGLRRRAARICLKRWCIITASRCRRLQYSRSAARRAVPRAWRCR